MCERKVTPKHFISFQIGTCVWLIKGASDIDDIVSIEKTQKGYNYAAETPILNFNFHCQETGT